MQIFNFLRLPDNSCPKWSQPWSVRSLSNQETRAPWYSDWCWSTNKRRLLSRIVAENHGSYIWMRDRCSTSLTSSAQVVLSPGCLFRLVLIVNYCPVGHTLFSHHHCSWLNFFFLYPCTTSVMMLSLNIDFYSGHINLHRYLKLSFVVQSYFFEVYILNWWSAAN